MMKNFDAAKISDMSEKEALEKLYAWSKGFHKFVCCPLSACFLQERTAKEIIQFYERTNKEQLTKVFVLYPHAIREKVLGCLNECLQKIILEDMYQFVRTTKFSLTECVDAEESMQDILEKLWSDRFNEYRELKEMEELIGDRIGKKEYSFSKDIHIYKKRKDIYLSVDVNLEEFHIRPAEPSWHSACYTRSLETYLFFLHEYIQNHDGIVHLDVVYAHKLPNLDEQEYFLLIYRIRNLVRLYSWIKLSNKLECQVQAINRLLKEDKFFSKITGNNLLSETTMLERIKAKFSDDIVNKNFAFWLFRETGKYKKTCIRIIDVADFWWVKDNCLTLLFFEVPSFEKTIMRMLLLLSLGFDVFLDNNIKLVDADRLILGIEGTACDGSEVRKIQCIIYSQFGIDAKHKEMFIMLNNNLYKDRIHFHCWEGSKLWDDRILELQAKTLHGICEVE